MNSPGLFSVRYDFDISGTRSTTVYGTLSADVFCMNDATGQFKNFQDLVRKSKNEMVNADS